MLRSRQPAGDEKGNFLSTQFKAIYGDPEKLAEIFGQSTAYIERSHLTMSRLTRKGIAFSKNIDMHHAAAMEDMY